MKILKEGINSNSIIEREEEAEKYLKINSKNTNPN